MTRLHRSAFTLIELLVVVTIIVVLLSLLTPAMDRAIEMAERAVCAANLRVFNTAVVSYQFENDRKILTTTRHYLHVAPFPNVPYVHAQTHPGDWSLGAMAPYTGGVGLDDVTGPWVCPSSEAFDALGMAQGRADRMKYPPGQFLTFDGTWIHSDYAYFAGANLWRTTHASVADGGKDLTDTRLTSTRILMTDTFYRHNQGWYWYNHGGYVRSGISTANGNNKMYGDGSVGWTDSFHPERNEAIFSGNTPLMGPYVIGTGDQASARSETNFY